MRLFGKEYTRREFEARVGRLEQIGGLRRLAFTEGRENGLEAIQVRTGAGLVFYVTPTKGMDISLAEFAGVPISWQSPNGDVHPAYYSTDENDWLQTASGGLLMTCGLTQVGSPCRDGGERLGLHGRAHHLSARHISTEGVWQGDEYYMTVSGEIEEVSLFGHHLRLTRHIRAQLGINRIVIDDLVENIGFQPAPHMLLYHFNFGFPLLGPQTVIHFPSRRVVSREKEVAVERFDCFEEPIDQCEERVFFHEDLDSEGNMAAVVISNPDFPVAHGGGSGPLQVRVSWSLENLPRLVQWKMPTAGVYALGIEPANCYVHGRVWERENGTLITLDPGQRLRYELHVEAGVQTAGC